jgi:ubiquinone/menaquinone biosynthesis C-methylase UbiE
MKPDREKTSAASSNSPTDWGDVADWYDQLVGESGSEYHREVVLPGTLRLLAAQGGDHVLDLACGQGVLCRLLAAKGIAVTGVDAAAELIRVARSRAAAPPAAVTQFHVADARDVPFLKDESFTSAACVLAIQNMHPLGPVFTEVSRLLQPGGRLVLVMMHPCFRGPKETQWGWDEKTRVQYRRVDRYLIPRKTPIVTHPGKDPGKYTWSFHKPIESYVKSLRNAGLLIDAIEEWPSHKKSTSGPRAGAENVAREEIPMFMAVRAVKGLGLGAALRVAEATTAGG